MINLLDNNKTMGNKRRIKKKLFLYSVIENIANNITKNEPKLKPLG